MLLSQGETARFPPSILLCQVVLDKKRGNDSPQWDFLTHSLAFFNLKIWEFVCVCVCVCEFLCVCLCGVFAFCKVGRVAIEVRNR